MAIGMTYEQYWYGDPLMVRAFYEAEKLRQKRRDEDAWMQGVYFTEALNATVGNWFAKEGTTPNRYPERPYLQEKKPEVKEPEDIEEQEMLWAKAWMTNFVQAGKHWGK